MFSVSKKLRLSCPYGDPEIVFDWREACTRSALVDSQRAPSIQYELYEEA